jgi:hypothetical protein
VSSRIKFIDKKTAGNNLPAVMRRIEEEKSLKQNFKSLNSLVNLIFVSIISDNRANIFLKNYTVFINFFWQNKY